MITESRARPAPDCLVIDSTSPVSALNKLVGDRYTPDRFIRSRRRSNVR
ncbi:MAG: hypothetical protein IPK58_10670 [Acidobacteria bacterium]|nr:hypothetical protein [Acidobacteriota bacterium]